MTRHRLLWTIVGVLLGALVVAATSSLIVAAYQSSRIRDTQQSNSPLIASTDRTLQVVLDCTTPGRECYDRGQRRMRSAITDINRVSIIAAACASGATEVTVEDIQACVIRRLAVQTRR